MKETDYLNDGDLNDKAVAKTLLKWFAWTAGVVFVCYVLGTIVYGSADWVLNPFRGKIEKQAIVVAGANQIASDNFFHQTYNDIIAQAKNVDVTKVTIAEFKTDHDMKNLNTVDSITYGNLQTTYMGQQNGVNALVADYNAKAKSDQYQSWRKLNLPESLPTDLNALKNLPPLP